MILWKLKDKKRDLSEVSNISKIVLEDDIFGYFYVKWIV